MPLLSYEGVAVNLPANLAGIEFEFTAGSLTIHCHNFTGDVVLSKREHSKGHSTSPIKKRSIDLRPSEDNDDEAEIKRQRPVFPSKAVSTLLLSQQYAHRSRHLHSEVEMISAEPEAEAEEEKMTKKATYESAKIKANTKMNEGMNILFSPEPLQSSPRKTTPELFKKRSKTLKLSPAKSINLSVSGPAKFNPAVDVKWKTLNALGSVPLERWGHTATKISDERVVVYGGTDDDERTLGDLHVFDMKTNRWTTPLNCETITRTWHDAVFLSSKNLVLVFGGERNAAADGKLAILSDIMVLDTKCFLWYPPAIQGSPPSARSGHTCTVIGNEMVVFGGSRGRNRQSSVYILNTDSWNWKTIKVEGKPPSARTYHSAVAVGENQIVYFGGNDSSKSFNAVHVLQKVTKKLNETKWTWVHPCVTGVPPQERTGHSATLLKDGKILIYGGWDPQRDDANAPASVFDDLGLLNTATWEWQPAALSEEAHAESVLRGRVGHGAVLDCNGNVHLFGGQNGVEQRLKDICTLTVSDANQKELKR